MGEVRGLFGDVPEPRPQKPREVSFRDVVEMKYADLARGFHEINPQATHAQLSVVAIGFLITQLGHARGSLKDIERTLAFLEEQHALLPPVEFSEVVLAAIASTVVHINKTLAFDETQVGLTPDTVPEGFENEEIDIPLCPGCGLGDAAKLPCGFMGAAHPFTRKEIALCADKHRPEKDAP